MNKTTSLVLGIAVAAIIISLVAIAKPTSSMQPNEQTYTGQTREFWLFNSDIPDFNETMTEMPHDAYSMQTMAVFKGDTVKIHFINMEDVGGDSHSFTIKDSPYAMNVELKPGEKKTITFVANATGTYSYFCTFHQPTMRGQLIVQSPT